MHGNQKSRVILCLIGLLYVFIVGMSTAQADSATIDFETFTAGTVNGQSGWVSTGAAGSGCAVYDHAVVNNTYSHAAAFGGTTLRISNAVTSGCFSDQTFSQSLVDAAGETAADPGTTSGGVRQNYFEASWQFTSANPSAEQAGLSVVVSPDRGDGARMSWIQMQDTPTGLAVNFFEYQTGPGFVSYPVAAGLVRDQIHTISVSMLFVDGIDNDVVTVTVNGNPGLSVTAGSWEDYFRNVESQPTRTVDSLLFRTAGVAAPATAGSGFLIDNITLTSSTLACGSTCYANAATGNDGYPGTAAFPKRTIQAAVDAVTTGGNVIVAAGTYPEQVTLTRNVTVTGAGVGSIIAPPSTWAVDSSLAGFNIYSLVTVRNGATATMSGFAVDGPFTGVAGDACNDLVAGAYIFENATFNLLNTAVTDAALGGAGLFGCQTGFGIRYGQYGGGSAGFGLVDTVTLTGYQKAGIIIDRNSSVTVEDSTITGIGPTDLTAQLGIQVSRGSTAVLQNNQITDNNYTPTSFSASGVLLFSAGAGVSIQGNTLTGNNGAVDIISSNAAVVKDNTLTGNNLSGVFVNNSDSVVIEGNTISGSNVGIQLYSFDSDTVDTTATVTLNSISNTSLAVDLTDDNTSDAEAPNIVMNRNSLPGGASNDESLRSNVATAMNIECNWWGDAAGPFDDGLGGPGPGSSGELYTPVTYDFVPWLTAASPLATAPCAGGLPVANNDTFTVVDNVATVLAVTDNDTRTEPLAAITIVTPPSNGTVTVTGTPPALVVTYTATNNYSGPDSFTYSLTDAVGVSNTATVNITVQDCTTVCYVSPTGSDSNSGLTPATAKLTIQAAIDDVNAGGQVRVLPGTYSETASNRFLFDGSGPYQFGLFFDEDKPGITVMGVTAADVPITSPAAVAAQVNTNATNGFGPSGIFVDAANITIQGLEIGVNSSGFNKTIEVIGDNFTLQHSHVNDPEGSVYINDFTAAGTRLAAYTITNNRFAPGVSVDLASGAGLTGPVSGRVITNNTFENSVGQFWPFISFNGSDTGVPWFVNSVGGAIITGNQFSYTDNSVEQQFIRARGTYDNTQFDWESYWNDNDFNKSTVTLTDLPTFDVRTYTYTSGSYTFANTRRITGQIQPAINRAQDGDTVLVNYNTLTNANAAYPENVNVNKDLTLLGPNASLNACTATRTFEAAINPVTGRGMVITVDGVTIDGLLFENLNADTIIGFGLNFGGDANNGVITNTIIRNSVGTGIYSLTPNSLSNWAITNNRIANLSGAGSSAINPWSIDGLTVTGNCIDTTGFAGILLDGSLNATISNNTIQNTTTQGIQVAGEIRTASNVTVQGNTITNANTSSAADRGGIRLYGAGLSNVTVTENVISNSFNGVAIRNTEDVSGTGIVITRNNVANNSNAGIRHSGGSGSGGLLSAECNWYGSISGPSGVGPGTGSAVLQPGAGTVDFSPWLTAASPLATAPCAGLPVANNDTFTVVDNVATVLAVTANDTLTAPLAAITLVTPPSNGTVTVTGTPPALVVTYTATNNYSGPDSFTYSLTDAVGVSNTATVNITVEDCTTTCYVSPTGSDSNSGLTPATAKLTIQAAIDDVNAGGTVIVGAGTYTANVNVNKAVTIEGPLSSVTNLGECEVPTGPQAVLQPSIAGNAHMSIAASDITIKGMTFTGGTAWAITQSGSVPNTDRITIERNYFVDIGRWAVYHTYVPGNPSSDWSTRQNFVNGWTGADGTGLLYWNMTNVEVVGNCVQNLNAVAGERGIGFDTVNGTANIQGNFIRDLSRWGIQLANSFADQEAATIRFNVIDRVQVGIQLVSLNASYAIRNTDVQGNQIREVTSLAVWAVDGSGGAGRFENITIREQSITQNVSNLVGNFPLIDIRLRPTVAHGAFMVSNNTVNLSGSFSGGVTSAFGIGLRGAVSEWTVTGNTLNGGSISGSAGVGFPAPAGILLRTNDTTYGPTPATAVVNIQQNVINGFAQGVALFNSVANTFGGVPAGADININRNDVSANSGGINNDGTSALVDAECNWYGDATGPSGVGPGTGTSVTANLDFAPWLTAASPLATAPCAGGLPVANNDTFTVVDNVATVLAVTANDTLTAPLAAITLVTPPSNGTVTVTGTPPALVVTYTATNNYSGPDSFTYSLTDAVGVSNTATVNITVEDCTTVCYVSPTGSDSNSGLTPADAKLTIQAAVDDVDTGGTVRVLAGTYNEQVTITRDMTIDGDGEGVSIVTTPASVNVVAGVAAFFDIRGGAVVTMQDLTIDGPIHDDGCAPEAVGIYVHEGASLTGTALTVHDLNLGSTSLYGCQTGFGIVVGGFAGATAGTANLTDVTVTDYQKGGILAFNAGTSLTVGGSTITTGPLVQPYIAPNGIQISDGATGSVTGSTISGNKCDLGGGACGPFGVGAFQASGIIVFNSPSVTISNNTISDNDMGVYNYGLSTTLSGNSFSANRYIGIFADEGTANVTSNTIDGGEYGVLVYAFDLTGVASDSVANLEFNVLTNTSVAISLIDEDPGVDFQPVLDANRNSIIGGSGPGSNDESYRNTTTVSMDIECNWWGDAAGPYDDALAGPGPSSSGEIYGPGDYTPWLTSSVLTGSCTGGLPGALQGTILLQSRLAPSPVMSVPVTVEFYAVGGSTPLYTFTLTTDTNGVFTTPSTIAPGTYVVWVKYERHLAVRLMSVVITSTTTTIETFPTMLAGDASNDNVVDLADLSIIAPTYDLFLSDVGYDARADFNGDDTTDLLDLSLIGANYEVEGAPRNGLP